MDIRRLSIKNLTITILMVIGFFSVLVSLISGDYFFKTAREAQLNSLARVIQVSTREMMQHLADQTYDVATTLSAQGAIPDSYSRLFGHADMSNFIKSLDDPFVTGFVGSYELDLVKIRAYDLTFDFVAESNDGVQGLPPQMPKILDQLGRDRKGVARTKAIAGLWQHADRSYYSVLVPIGGIFISGYLEVVVDPVINLIAMSHEMESPMSIRSGINPAIVYHEPEQSVEDLLPVEFILNTDMGKPAYIIISYEDIAELSAGINKIVFNTVFIFITLVVIVLFLASWLFQHFLFKPMNMMLEEIRHVTDGDISRDLQINGLTEISMLAEEFNKMAKEIRCREAELTHLSVVDELTRVANRRKFDEVLKSEYLIACRTEKPLSVLMIDIDYFKLFNDTYGHLAGDDCLKKVAAALECAVSRPADLVARYGGEEFAIILPDTGGCGERVVAENVMNEIAKLAIPHSGSVVNNIITVSIGGYTLIPSPQQEPIVIIAEADKSLYLAKEAGRNQFVLRS